MRDLDFGLWKLGAAPRRAPPLSFFIPKLSTELIDGKLSVDYMTRREVDADAAAMTQTTIAGPGGHKIARTARVVLL